MSRIRHVTNVHTGKQGCVFVTRAENLRHVSNRTSSAEEGSGVTRSLDDEDLAHVTTSGMSSFVLSADEERHASSSRGELL